MMHDTTRNYIRQMLQARLEELTHRMAGFATDSIHEFAQAAEEIRIVANSIADLMTHHVDVPQPAATEPREVRAALHLYQNVLKSADTIRDMEVRLGLSDQANTKPHNLLRDMTKFIEHEKRSSPDGIMPTEMSVAQAVEHVRNGAHKKRPIITENLG
ncbi:MAG TPA: hypothetical protein VMT30_02535 [Candidatus Saccharimonadia bacterium]|nr:hypothetical protein [Candidatus Saccharimonadia bacterium]